VIWLATITRRFTGSRAGRFAALVGAVILAILGVRRAGYRAAKRDRDMQDARAALDIRRRADEAMRRADGDNRPADERIAKHGRLRDD